MRSFLLQPYPFSENAARKLAVCGGIGLFITLFLGVFKPFGFDQLATGTQWKHAFFFGWVTFVISSLFQILLPKIFPKIFQEEHWKSWKEIVYLLVTTIFVGAGNYSLIRLLYPSEITMGGFLQAQLITFEVGLFPILFVVFMKQLTLYRKFTTEAAEVTSDLSPEKEKKVAELPAPSQKIKLSGDNQKEELLLLPEQLYFISSADNYVQVQYKEGGNEKSLLMRSSLKKIQEQLADYPAFFRCHRMYLVNLQLVHSVTGNAQGLKLHLSGIDEPIPVSRHLTETIRNKLHQLSHSPQTAWN